MNAAHGGLSNLLPTESVIHPWLPGSTAGRGKPQHVRDELSPSEDCFPTNLHSAITSVWVKPQRVNIVRTLRLFQTRPKTKGLLLVLVKKINNTSAGVCSLFFKWFGRIFHSTIFSEAVVDTFRAARFLRLIPMWQSSVDCLQVLRFPPTKLIGWLENARYFAQSQLGLCLNFRRIFTSSLADDSWGKCNALKPQGQKLLSYCRVWIYGAKWGCIPKVFINYSARKKNICNALQNLCSFQYKPPFVSRVDYIPH